MNIKETLQKFVIEGESYLIYTTFGASLSGNVLEAVITEVGDGWISITETDGSQSIVNMENVIRVRKYPKKKNGKKKVLID